MAKSDGAEPEVLFDTAGGLGRITLNRRQAINALTHTMVGLIADQLDAWAEDERIAAVAILGAGERGLCAGGDIRSIYDDALAGGGATDTFWADEYRLNLMIAAYPKPYLAVMDGLVMGGGVGISAHGSHRIVTERSRVSMPEVKIGFVPDVGGTRILADAPGCTGIHVGLTAMALTAADAITCGFADVFVPVAAIPAVLDEIAAGEDVDAALSRQVREPEPGVLDRIGTELAPHYRLQTVAAIVASMEADSNRLACETAATLRTVSPVSAEVTLASIRRARELTGLAEVVQQEYRVSLRALRSGEFIEGIRAQIIDKDRDPRWQPATLEEVDPAVVAGYFESLGEQELALPEARGGKK